MKMTAYVASPFDPFIARLLTWGASQPNGFSHPDIVRAMSDSMDWQAAFAEAVFVAARVRGLIGPHFGTRSRGRLSWQVTRQGKTWLDDYERIGNDVARSPSPDTVPGPSTESETANSA